MKRTVEQTRAKFALAFIGRHTDSNAEKKDKLSTHIHKSPSLILQCGLGQALAFLLADAGGDSNKPSMVLYQELQIWLCGERNTTYPVRVYSGRDLLNELLSGSRADYFRAQEESLMLFNWLKKIAAAKL
jgi:CRISPR type III-B/RAMP module-associated protein Cmr5